MSFINTTTKTRVIVNGTDVSEYVIEGNVSDESNYSSNIIKTSGTIQLAQTLRGSNIIDIDQITFPIGSRVSVYVTYDDGRSSLHPRGTLFVTNSTVNVENKILNLEVGCSLFFIEKNEEAYIDAIEQLYDELIPPKYLSYFPTEEKNLGHLQSLLETIGISIYQDCYGFIQRINLFGSDSYGKPGESKLTSYDKYTAINIESISNTAVEDNVKGVQLDFGIELGVEPKDDGDNEDDDNGDNDNDDNNGDLGKVEYAPLIKSITYRKITKPVLRHKIQRFGSGIVEGTTSFYIVNDPEAPEDELIVKAQCGTIRNPKEKSENDGKPRSRLKAYGGLFVFQDLYRETVTSGSATLFGGDGNQSLIEESWEHASIYSYASSFWSGVCDIFVRELDTLVQDANTLLSKANQYYDKITDMGGWNEQVTTVNGKVVSRTGTKKEYIYNLCQAEYYYNAAVRRINAANSLFIDANNWIQNISKKVAPNNLSNYNITINTYNPDGSLSKKVDKSYINKFQRQRVLSALGSVKAIYSTSIDNLAESTEPGLDDPTPTTGEDSFKYVGLDFTAVNSALQEDLSLNDQPVSSGDVTDGDLESSADYAIGVFRDFDVPSEPLYMDLSQIEDYGLALVSVRTIDYAYNPNTYDVQTEQFADFENPNSSYIRKSFSANGSSRPELEDSIPGNETSDRSEEPDKVTTLDGQEYCAIDTDTKDLSVFVAADTDTYKMNQGWFGAAEPYTKFVSLPLDFAPLLPKRNSNGTCEPIPNYSGKLLELEGVARRYCQLIAQKISGDNRGFRITEKMRAELAEYYPFFPISISVESIGKGFFARTAAATWGFDSDNAICSIDCYVTGVSSPQVFPEPTRKTVNLVANASKTLLSQDLKLNPTCVYTKVKTLPTGGVLRLSGTSVNINDTISVSLINAGNLIFTPFGSSYVTISFSFEQYSQNNVLLSSIQNIYPENTVVLPNPGQVIGDGGDFTLSISSGPTSADAGNLFAGTSLGGVVLDGGNFATGEEVLYPEVFMPNSPEGNGEADPEQDYSDVLVDNSGQLIPNETLPTVSDASLPALPVVISFSVNPLIMVDIFIEILEFRGWDYSYIRSPYGFSVNMGGIDDPSTLSLDFGAIQNPQEPYPSSFVS